MLKGLFIVGLLGLMLCACNWFDLPVVPAENETINVSNDTIPVENDTIDIFEPIVSLEALSTFTNDLLGIACDRENWTLETTVGLSNDTDIYGYYGNRGSMIVNGTPHIVAYISFAECKIATEFYPEENDSLITSAAPLYFYIEGDNVPSWVYHTLEATPSGGTFAYRLSFDPNNGYIYQQTCNYNFLPDECPKDENGTYVWIDDYDPVKNPNYEAYFTLNYPGLGNIPNWAVIE